MSKTNIKIANPAIISDALVFFGWVCILAAPILLVAAVTEKTEWVQAPESLGAGLIFLALSKALNILHAIALLGIEDSPAARPSDV